MLILFIILCKIFILINISYIKCQSVKNVINGFPERWDGDKFNKLYCPSKNIPKFIDGYFLCQLSASYGNPKSPPGQKLTHMIDAIGAVGSFQIKNGQVEFLARYYPSKPYKIWEYYDRNMTKSSVPWAGWSDYNVTAMTKWDQIPNNIDSTKFHPNLDFWKIGNKIIAGTEAPYWVGYEFDVSKLTDFKQHPFIEDNDIFNNINSKMISISMSIHERVDENGILWGTLIAMDFYKQIFYQVIFTIDSEKKRKVISMYNFGEWDINGCGNNDEYIGDKGNLPGYIHSITSTKNYIILPITSLLINPCKFKEPLNEINSDGIRRGGLWGMDFYNMAPVRFLVFNKKTSEWITKKALEVFPSMFISHQLNAYENKDGQIVCDMIVYDNHDPYVKYFYSTFLTKHLYPSTARLLRFILDINKFKVMYNYLLPQETISADFPQINHDYETKIYEWTYLVEYPFASDNSILKINVQDPTGSQNTRYRADHSMSLHEPYFISSPGAVKEDDGVLLVRALDLLKNKASLIFINATTMNEIGRSYVSINIPFGFHNRFFSRESLGMKSTSPMSEQTSKSYNKSIQTTIINNILENEKKIKNDINMTSKLENIIKNTTTSTISTIINVDEQNTSTNSTIKVSNNEKDKLNHNNNITIFDKNTTNIGNTKLNYNKTSGESNSIQLLRERLLKFHKQAGHIRYTGRRFTRTTQLPPTTSHDDGNNEFKLETPITKAYLFTPKISTTTLSTKSSKITTVSDGIKNKFLTTEKIKEERIIDEEFNLETTTKDTNLLIADKDKVTKQFYDETLKAICSWIPKVFKTITMERCLESGKNAIKWMTPPTKDDKYSNQFINLNNNKTFDNNPLVAEIVKRIRAAHITKLLKESHIKKLNE
ncbi:Carotenoid oxygenase family-containing protein [Strongyloides ratti]|uniref:Carotenoid oxygenase family-containing protein n=1 Tax=Strongyloides ratti TaxID=34506 RepID=A0A090KTE0_STRRB|nr:Carotenoid oxygenase family-containing protein [Strongyloides ratti]CEF60755.1 Carotenoid oxygenase family-containing protein [Strongyloides ratti]